MLPPVVTGPIVEPEDKSEVTPVLNRPPPNMHGDTLDDREALTGETRREARW